MVEIQKTDEMTHRKTTPLKTTTCPDCQKVITVKGLKRHRKDVHGLNLQPIHCNMCDKVFKRNAHLKDHQRRIHFEPVERGRPAKKKPQSEKKNRPRSPFRVKEFNHRHGRGIELNNTVEVNINSLKTDLSRLQNELRQKSIEMDETKIRLSILEAKQSKQTKQNRPELNNVPALFEYIGLDVSASINEIRAAINIRILEVSPESMVDSAAMKHMTDEQRDDEYSFLNRASDVLIQWKKDNSSEEKKSC